VISQEIALDKLIDDIDVQIEILTAISDNNAILSEQLRLLYESREQLLSQNLEISRLSELIDPDNLHDHTTQFEHQVEQQLQDQERSLDNNPNSQE
jgi:hypothetical protein|tara:strand:+ start:21889 stop:22176 length:288 start_codon:yes stop_codon:yes gene_type:complete